MPPITTPSMLSEMLIDIYASKRKAGEITILHDKPLSPRLRCLEYHPGTHRLLFVFENGLRRDLGSAIQPLLQPHFEVSESVLFMPIEGRGKAMKPRPLDAEIIPLLRCVDSLPPPAPARGAGEALHRYFSALATPQNRT